MQILQEVIYIIIYALSKNHFEHSFFFCDYFVIFFYKIVAGIDVRNDAADALKNLSVDDYTDASNILGYYVHINDATQSQRETCCNGVSTMFCMSFYTLNCYLKMLWLEFWKYWAKSIFCEALILSTLMT